MYKADSFILKSRKFKLIILSLSAVIILSIVLAIWLNPKESLKIKPGQENGDPSYILNFTLEVKSKNGDQFLISSPKAIDERGTYTLATPTLKITELNGYVYDISARQAWYFENSHQLKVSENLQITRSDKSVGAADDLFLKMNSKEIVMNQVSYTTPDYKMSCDKLEYDDRAKKLDLKGKVYIKLKN